MFELLRVYVSALATVAPLVMCGGAGYLWGKRRLNFDAHFVSDLVMLIGVPALIFHTLYSTEITNSALLEIGLVSTLAIFLAIGLSALALKLLQMERRPNLQIVSFPNSGNLGLPLSALAFGDIGLSVAIVFFAICTFLHSTVGLRTISNSPDSGGGGSSGKALIMGSAFAAVAARLANVSLPEWLLQGLELMGSVTVPLMLLSLGVTLASISTKGLRVGSVIAGLRLAVGLISAVVICWLLGTPTALAPIIVLQMTMPCAVMGYVYVAKFAPGNGQVAASAVLVSTLVFLAASPLLIAGLKHFYGQ